MRNEIKSLDPQGTLVCPICGKVFEANDDTKYIMNGGYVCEWKCFWKEVNRREAIKKQEAIKKEENKKNKK